MDIIMKTFIGDSGNYEDMPLSKVLDIMTDDWIDEEVTFANIFELRDACKRLLKEQQEEIMVIDVSYYPDACIGTNPEPQKEKPND